MSILQIIIGTIVTLGILVTIHEFGHFWVARRCGVKVLRFSVGFGKALYRWYDRHGTEYMIAAIPLGGYVKMLDEREGEVAPQERHQAFNSKPVGQRIAIVVAGPAANFLFAILVYWLLFVIGINTVVPVIGEVKPDSAAAVAGLQEGQEITAVGDTSTASWQAINIQLLSHIGESGRLSITTRELRGDVERSYSVPVTDWLSSVEQPDPLADLGIIPYYPPIPAVVGQIMKNGAGERAGLKSADKIVAVDARPMKTWRDVVDVVKANPGTPLLFEVQREGQPVKLIVTPERKVDEMSGNETGYIGVGVEPVPWPQELQREINYSLFSAWGPALAKTWDMTVLTLESLKKMLVGLISIKNLSGPITIAKVAGASVDKGLEPFLNFLAYLSISLGLINILPIPVLDGGHLMYYLVELVRGRPVSEKAQLLGLRIGMSIIMALMLLAIYNDITRL